MSVDESSLSIPTVAGVAEHRGPPRDSGVVHTARQHIIACHLRADAAIRVEDEELREPRPPLILLIVRGERHVHHARRDIDVRWCLFDTPGITTAPGGRVRVALPGLAVERSHRRALSAAEGRAAYDLLRELRRHVGSPDAGARIAAAARLFDLLALWARPSADAGESAVEQYRALIERHACDDTVSLAALARQLDRDLDHLGARFRRAHGLSPIEYRTRARLLRGREALIDGAVIAEAARAAGIADQRYFARLFRRRYGMTPSEFARSARRV